MNKEKLTDNIKQHKKKIVIVMIALLLIGGGSIYALTSNADTPSSKNGKNNEISTKDKENRTDDNKASSDDKESDEKSSDDNTTSSDNEDTKKDTKSNSTSTSNNDDKKSSNESSSTDKPSNDGSNSSNNNTSKPNTPSHEHSWIEQYKTIHHDEIKTLIKDAWTEQVPVFEYKERRICNVCEMDVTDVILSSSFKTHVKQVHPDNTGSHRSEWKEIQVGAETVFHDAEYSTTPAWDEKISTGFKCSGCGATK